MRFSFPSASRDPAFSLEDWRSWQWQLRRSAADEEGFARFVELTADERRAFRGASGKVVASGAADAPGEPLFAVRGTPYYLSLLGPSEHDPIRRILVPRARELEHGNQQMLDPLGERKGANNPVARIVHRYPDRVLFLVTDFCSVYCRYCTRKHFTGQDRSLVGGGEYRAALAYLRAKTGIREVILSGGDPLTLGDAQLGRVLEDLRAIEHVEIIRIGTRMPVVCPMRVTPELTRVLRKANPLYLMVHFNHPRELTAEAAEALTALADAGIPLFNQMVLLNGVNNDPAIVQALSRRLLYLRVKPYYMFQCDPSMGTDHLRTSVEESLEIQRELWGRLSGLALPNLSLDIPDGGGKTGLVPNFEIAREPGVRHYRGWDGVESEYRDPAPELRERPLDAEDYRAEWESLKNAKL